MFNYIIINYFKVLLLQIRKYGTTNFHNTTEELIRLEKYIITVYEILKTNCLHDYGYVSLSAFVSDFADLVSKLHLTIILFFLYSIKFNHKLLL